MWRIFIIVSIAPFMLGGICANCFGLRVLLRDSELSDTVEKLLQKTLQAIRREDIAVEFVRASIWSHSLDKSLKLPQRFKQSNKTVHVSRAMVQLGLFLLHEKHEATVKWRAKAVRTGYILPTFVLLIVLFSTIVGKLPIAIAFAAISASLGLTTIMLWLSLAVEKEAAHLMVSRVEKFRILPRLREEEELVSAIRAIPWVSLIPGALLKFILRD